MSTESTTPSSARSCETCLHFQPYTNGLGSRPTLNRCARYQTYADWAVQGKLFGIGGPCGIELRGYHSKSLPPPRAPRRSLRQWAYDTFWK